MAESTNNQARPTPAAGALGGIRVIDLTRVLAGPWCAQILADLGADVIKVERPGRGDDSRAWGPPFVMNPDGTASAESAFYWACNRGKRSVVLDLARPAGQAVVLDLARHADVVVENFKAGTLDRYGLGYSVLASANPRLVHCSITGFGETGPYRSRPGYDTIIQAIGGLMSVTGRADGAPGAGPMKAGVAVTDLMTALYATIAILAALQERTRSGLGQHIDMALLDVQVASLANIAENFLLTGRVPERIGNRLPTVYPSDAFRCLDGDIMLIVGNDAQFRRFCEAADLGETWRDPRFADNAARLQHASALESVIAPALARGTVRDWIGKFEAAGIACSPINNLAQVFDDPQVKARAMVRPLTHPSAGPVPTVASPIHLSRTPVGYDRAPPGLGVHTVEVLREVLGLSAEDAARVARDNAVGGAIHEE